MNRRTIRAGVALVATGALLTLAACGGSDDDGSAGSGGETHTVTGTMRGDVKDVPVKPKRVVALWRTGAELVDLGVKPVAALEGEFLNTELAAAKFAKVKKVPTVGNFEGVDVEKVIDAKPDLIVGMDNGGLSIDYKELSKVAPTVIFKIAEPPDVWKNYPKLAKVVGRSTDYQDRNADLEKSLRAVAKRHGNTIGKAQAVSVSTSSGPTYVDTSKSLTWQRIDAAGFGYLERYATKPKRYAEELSSENIPKLSGADAIFYNVDIQGKPAPGTDKLLKSASFKRLPAVKAGNLFPLTSGTIYTFQGAHKQVDDLRAAAKKYQPVKRDS
ncbi:ABC transporter substrate-binding protein [Streptomyces sp. NPDC005438]|uniref:ABC transporter substrate-binding protein n=1 Tax=Streptomyces sp. NPDC005438 TaxID=3156880 RepID=UPI0033A860D7